MFRRDPDVLKAYTANKPEACAVIQSDILRRAAETVRPGGRLVYSTCTFNTIENEGIVEGLLAAHTDFCLLGMKRIWPHKDIGEGHFAALLERRGADAADGNISPSPVGKHPPAFIEFCGDYLYGIPPGRPFLRENSLYLQPEDLAIKGLRTARSGWYAGETVKGRFIPSQALAMGLRREDARHAIDLSEDDAWRYIKGESLGAEGHPPMADTPGKPWLLICRQGHPLGWARLVQGRLKNQLPTGWVRA
jgi:NOL1/NOP2/fmu family ribosome biogenesis protein